MRVVFQCVKNRSKIHTRRGDNSSPQSGKCIHNNISYMHNNNESVKDYKNRHNILVMKVERARRVQKNTTGEDASTNLYFIAS